MFLSHAKLYFYADFAEGTRSARAAIRDIPHPSLTQVESAVCA